jgi:sarcosine oxidase subunit alpha
METMLRMKDHPILRVERGQKVQFHFDGKPITAYERETIAAALFAAGIRIFSRSFKYHRPRGLFCMSGHCSNCLMRVDGIPNVRTCMEQVRPGMRVESQNAWPSLKFDLAALTGSLDFLVRPGFQYRRFIRPRWAYHIWEKFLRRMAGIGSLADIESPVTAERVQATVEIVVVGGGTAGLSAAFHAAKAGSGVLLVEKEQMLGGRGLYDTAVVEVHKSQTKEHRFVYVTKLAKDVEGLSQCSVLKGATAFAWYDEGVLAVSRPGEFWEVSPGRVIIATGSYDNPMVFDNNDLPGIFLSGGLQRLMHRFYIRPGNQAVVATGNDNGYAIAQQLLDAGVNVSGIVDDRSEKEIFSFWGAKKIKDTKVPIFSGSTIKAATGRRQVNGVVFSKMKLVCDAVCIAGTRTPANELVFQRTCEGTYILESQNQFTRKPLTDTTMRVHSDMFVVGGASGGQGVNRAWLEGKVAGLTAAIDLGHGGKAAEVERNDAMTLLSISKEKG